MSNLNVNKISAVGGGSTITIAGIASVTNNLTSGNISVASSVTAVTYYGDGANLTNIAADKIFEGNTEVETIDTGSDGHIKFTTEGTERLRITSSGLVGIGTNSPDNLLEIFKGSTGTYLKMGGDDAQNGRALTFTSGNTSSNGALHTLNATSSNGAIAFATAGTERMRIDSVGFVQGNINSPVWFGSQDTSHNVATGTWVALLNLGNSVINPSINNGGWNESTGTFTAQAGQAGYYYCYGCAGIDDVQDSDIVYCGISKNGADPIFYTENRALDQSSNIILGGVMVAQVIQLAVGDTAQLRVYHNEGSTEPTEQNRCFFGGYRLAIL